MFLQPIKETCAKTVTVTFPTDALVAVFVAAVGVVVGVVTACLPDHLKVVVWRKFNT